MSAPILVPPPAPLPPGPQQQRGPTPGGQGPHPQMRPMGLGMDDITSRMRNLDTGPMRISPTPRIDGRRPSLTDRRPSSSSTKSLPSDPVIATDGSPVIYEGWVLTKADDSNNNNEPRWTRVVRNMMNADHAELKRLIQKSKERKEGVTGLEQFQRLDLNKQMQIDRLIADRRREDRNPTLQWGYALVETKEREVKRNGRKMTEVRSILAVLKKKFPRNTPFQHGVPPVLTKLSGTLVDLLVPEKKDKDKDEKEEKLKEKKDNVTPPGSVVTTTDGKRYFISQEGKPIPLDPLGRPVVMVPGGPQLGPHPSTLSQPSGPMTDHFGPMPNHSGPMQHHGPGPIPSGGPPPQGQQGGPFPIRLDPEMPNRRPTPHGPALGNAMSSSPPLQGRGGGNHDFEAFDNQDRPKSAGKKGGKPPKIFNQSSGSRAPDWSNRDRRHARVEDSSEDDDASFVFEDEEEQSSVTENISDLSDESCEKQIPRRGSLPRPRRGSSNRHRDGTVYRQHRRRGDHVERSRRPSSRYDKGDIELLPERSKRTSRGLLPTRRHSLAYQPTGGHRARQLTFHKPVYEEFPRSPGSPSRVSESPHGGHFLADMVPYIPAMPAAPDPAVEQSKREREIQSRRLDMLEEQLHHAQSEINQHKLEAIEKQRFQQYARDLELERARMSIELPRFERLPERETALALELEKEKERDREREREWERERERQWEKYKNRFDYARGGERLERQAYLDQLRKRERERDWYAQYDSRRTAMDRPSYQRRYSEQYPSRWL